MTFSFDPERGLVVVNAEVRRPTGTAILRLALDTGATTTLLNGGPLVAIGYDPALAPERMEFTTGSGIEFAVRISLDRFTVLGRTRHAFPALCHTLPPSSGVDGLVGLDFLRGRVLTVDFQQGKLALA